MRHEGSMTNQPQTTQPVKTETSRGGIKWFLLIPAILCVLGTVTFFLRAQESKKLAAGTSALDTEPVTLTQAQKGASDSEISLPSTLQGYSDSPVYARTSGYVGHWYADIGTHVHQGELLAQIESPEVDQELNQARASLSQTQANLVLAGITAKRYQELIPTNAVAQQEVDQNNQNLDAQKAGVQAAIANVNRLEQLQGFEKVIAPFDGVITQRRTDIGDLINAGNSGMGAELFRISKINIVRVFVPVPESYSDQISDGLKATLELIALPGQQFEGTVTRSSHSISIDSHTLLTEIDVPNPSGKLLPGAYAQVHIHLNAPVQHLVVPVGAVLFQAAGPQIAVVNGNNQIELHKVALGRDFGNTIEITNGITESDRIVASPPDYLVNGMQVTIQPAAGGEKS
jgi:RND family efflux transporter MFP subunit